MTHPHWTLSRAVPRHALSSRSSASESGVTSSSTSSSSSRSSSSAWLSCTAVCFFSMPFADTVRILTLGSLFRSPFHSLLNNKRRCFYCVARFPNSRQQSPENTHPIASSVRALALSLTILTLFRLSGSVFSPERLQMFAVDYIGDLCEGKRWQHALGKGRFGSSGRKRLGSRTEAATPLELGSLSFHRLLYDRLSGEMRATLTPFDAVGQLDLLQFAVEPVQIPEEGSTRWHQLPRRVTDENAILLHV